jgi:pre-mRNA-processing factor 17
VCAGSRAVKRTYLGHAAAVKEARFSPDASRFMSCSYDKHAKVWDTETGACVADVSDGKVPNCVAWYPVDPNIVLTGTASRRVQQYDLRTGPAAVLEYNYHLSAVNSITFIDSARRMVTTGDDKQILVWEWNAPIPITYIKDPTLHSVPAVAAHPDGASLAGQSMDNTVMVLNVGDSVGINRKKRFTGHITAGYACQLAFSPNGQYLASGDGDGNVWFWDWKTTRVVRKMPAHERQPCIGVAWHPIFPSLVATCSWDGTVRLWE